MTLSEKDLSEALSNLSERLAYENVEPIGLLVCGGAAMIIQNFRERVTKDVDVLSLVSDGLATNPAPLPEVLEQQARIVADDLDLPADWLNNGPSRNEFGLFQVGLPDGVVSRAERREFGTHLTIWFTGRLDLIYTKVYAIIDTGPGRHLDDLNALSPSSEELVGAVQWCRTHDPSAGFHQMAISMLESLDYHEAANTIRDQT